MQRILREDGTWYDADVQVSPGKDLPAFKNIRRNYVTGISSGGYMVGQGGLGAVREREELIFLFFSII